MKKLMAMVLVTAAVRALAAPVASEPFGLTTALSSEGRVTAAAATDPDTTFWSSAISWNAGIIDVLRRILTGMSITIK